MKAFSAFTKNENGGVNPETMPQAEAEEFLWRIGPLNSYNPMKPDRYYDLDLTHRDDREICKARTVTLATATSPLLLGLPTIASKFSEVSTFWNPLGPAQ